MDKSKQHIAVAGAGIVGVSCALWLQKKGFKVTLIDGNRPGSITSSGNACTIADYGCIPVNEPNLVKRLPKLMFGNDSPLTINPWYAITHLPWMLAFLKKCKPVEVNKTIAALGTLLNSTDDGLNPLIELTRSGDLLETNGCMYVYRKQTEFAAAFKNNQYRREQGAEFTELSGAEVYDLEPNLQAGFERGIIFKNARQVLNPQDLVTRFFDHFIDAGGGYVDSHASGIIHNESGMKIFLHNKKFLRANKIVICCGAFSKQVEGCDAEKLPLDTERGYHIQYSGKQHLANRPIAWAECGFYATPMNEGLRFAGTVEIAGLSRPKNRKNIDYLISKSKQMFALESPPDSDWLGYRPTLPDSIPVIGPSRRSPNTYYAFGHQHIGLTLAGITGKLISELINEETPSINLAAYSANRFQNIKSPF